MMRPSTGFRLFLVAVLLAAAQLCHGADDLAARLGNEPFGTIVREGIWGQRLVQVCNNTDSRRLVKVNYLAPGSGGQMTRYCRVWSVPANCIRDSLLTIRPDRLTKIRGRNPETAKAEEAFTLTDPRTGELLGRDYTYVSKLTDPSTQLATIADVDEPHDTSSYLKKLPDRDLGDVRLLRTPIGFLPDRWYGYGIVDVLILGGLKPTSLGQSQTEAIGDWVRRGGTMLITASSVAPEMFRGELADAAGVSVIDVHYVTRLSATKPNATPIAPVELEWPLPMVQLLPTGAEVLYRANGLPLLTRHRLGHGWVLTLAVPLGAVRDKSLHGVFREIDRVMRFSSPVEPDNFPAAAAVLNSIAGRRGSGRAGPVTILAVLTVVAVAAGLVGRLRRRGEIVWLVLIPAAMLTALALYAYSLSQTDHERLSTIGLMAGLDDSSARVQQFSMYYSGSTSRVVTFSADSRRGIIEALGSDEGLANLATVETGDDGVLSLPGREVFTNSSQTFYVDAVEPTGGLVCELTFDQAGLAGTLTNRLGSQLTDAVIYANGKSYRLGDLSAEEATKVSLSRDDLLGTGEFTGSLIRSQQDTLQNSLVQALLGKPSVSRRVVRRPVILGYMRSSPLKTLPDRQIDRQGWCVVLWPLCLSRVQAGSKVSIPAGFVNLKFHHRGPIVWNPTRQMFHQTVRGTELIVLARPPEATGRLKDASAHLDVHIRAGNYRLIVGGVMNYKSAGERTVELGQFENPAGIMTVDVPDADRFVNTGGEFVFSLRVQRIGRQLESSSPIRNAAEWTFESVDVALEGVSQ
ncbi:MAG: hypothetical protein SVT52_02525 [Planctomycetota bacterium]|nr:hypothetical protein [Planctomycetota bacterium]